MLKAEKFNQLQSLINTVSREELIWINGYLSALVLNDSAPEPVSRIKPANVLSPRKISLVYGTETGNSKRLATQLAALARKNGCQVRLTGLDQYRINDLSKEAYLIVVISTQGEGEPPATARKWYDHIHKNGFQLPNLKYGVLALGDSSYPFFCKTGEDVDNQLAKLGGQRLITLRKCDLDYEADALEWFNQVLNTIDHPSEAVPAVKASEPGKIKKSTGKKYYQGSVITHINLNDKGSRKETYHIEIGCEEPVSYEPGDALAVVPRNRPAVVERILELSGVDPGKEITTARTTATVRELLSHSLNICYLLSSTIRKYAALTGHRIPDTRMDLVDLLRIYPVKDPRQMEEALQFLTPIAPRLYSISSAPSAHENEIHLTVARNVFEVERENRTGLCSEYLGDLTPGSEIRFYIHTNRTFKLPAADKDIIMIGPGTGVAPFRSFLAERDACSASGRNWFFFGEQQFVTDFLYQTEMQNFLDTGVLSNLSLAFSRDQREKIYVQDRMKERGQELFEWLEDGAHIYVSGTKDPMSLDVERAWLEIIREKGGKSEEESKQYWDELKKQGRYQRDVY